MARDRSSEAVQQQQPVENWWTPGRVRRLLSVYPQLKEAAYLDCRIDAPDGETARGGMPSQQPRLVPRTIDLVMMKADLDVAIARLPVHLRLVALAYYVEGMQDVLAVAKMLGKSVRTVFSHKRQALDGVIEHLCAESRCSKPPTRRDIQSREP